MWVLRLIRGICSFFAVAGLLGIAAVLLGEIVGWQDSYPLIFDTYEKKDGSLGFENGTAWEYTWQVGVVVIGSVFVGGITHGILSRRGYY